MRSQWIATSIALGLLVPAAAGSSGEGLDCNGNGIPDDAEIAGGLVTDCNTNGIPDPCDLANGTSADCNGDGFPDECLLCPAVDMVFIMDTSGSMFDEGIALCTNIDDVVAQLNTLGIQTQASFFGVTKGPSMNFPCLQGSVVEVLGPQVPGTGELIDDEEDWGPAAAVVADRFGWMPGAVRVIVTISDEGAQDGSPCENPGPDGDAIANAIQIANQAGVICSPIAAGGSSDCVVALATALANGTGGIVSLSTDPAADLAQAILEIALQACQGVTDCNDNMIPDECEPDCNGNGIPDDCDGGCPPVDLGCEEFDRFEDLTPNDTFSVITNFHNPEAEQGYVYAYATANGEPIGFDHLIGQMLIVSGLDAFEYATNAIDYRAAVPPGLPTDLDGDGIRDLNGLEYELTAGELLVPRFLGQVPGTPPSELILIALSGGTEFDTTVDFLVYNDNEVPFSGEVTFFCWDKIPLLEISGAFSNSFLQNSSGDDPEESLGGNREAGWFRFDGAVASSTTRSITDPAVYGVYVERVGSYAAADLPFELCARPGRLLPRDVNGDNEELPGLPSQQDCGVARDQRRPGSLLIFPEFNNRAGVVSVLTVTNTNPRESTRLHMRYIGRYGAP